MSGDRPTVKVYPRGAAISGNIYAHAGEATYCENGHRVATFTTDVEVGHEAKPDDFDLEPGMEIGRTECPWCDGRTVAGPGIYFFEAFE